MPIDLNSTLERWLEEGGSALRRKIDEEIGNRLDYYATIGDMLSQRPIDIPRFTTAALNCWVLDRYTKIRLNAFARDESYAQELIGQLINALPEYPDEIARHIDEFIEYAVAGGFVDQNGARDLAGAAALASLVLTAKYPGVFVDYPSRKRWKHFVECLGYALPNFDAHGQRIVWVSDFAQGIVAQRIFRLTWPDTEPMWVVSALCWASGREREEEALLPKVLPSITAQEAIPAEFDRLSLAELRRKALEKASLRATSQERKANYYVRSHAIRVYAFKRAGGICEGCDTPAPFDRPSGEPFLEMHHIDRLADGGPDSPDAVIARCPAV